MYQQPGQIPGETRLIMKNFRLVGILCLLQLSLSAQEPVSVGNYRKFKSAILGGEVTYLEHLPDGYEKSGKTYPVVFIMNGQNTPQFANDAATLDNLEGERIPDMILIGISNTGVARLGLACPDDSGQVKSGETFCSFLADEFIPEISRNYRTNDYRILSGQSNTGLFVMYQFLFHPEVFNAYVIASPMFGWCPGFFFDKTRSFQKDHPRIRKKLYISYGDLDYIQVLKPVNDFKEAMKQSPPGLEWKVELIENTGHVPSSTLNNALLYFFAGCTLTPERKKLSVPEIQSHFNKLSGEYGFIVNPKAGVLFDLTYDLADEGKTGKAIEMNKYLVSLYPDSEIYVYFLGTLYQKAGETVRAKECYNQALKINPEFEAARKALGGI